jgi:tetratricopeptide (TPR) repeat protein
LTDLGFIEQRIGVMSRGKWMSKDALSKSLATLPSQYIGLANRGLTAMKIGPDAFSAFQNANDPYNLMTQYLVLELLKTGGSASYAKYVDQMSKKEPNNGLYKENGINNFGYFLMNTRKQIGLAIQVFAVNVQRYPKSANVYDSLAEGYLNLGNKSKAIEFYRKAVKIDPKYPSSLAALRKLGVMK